MAFSQKQNNVLLQILLKVGEYGAIFVAVWQLGIPAAEKFTYEKIDEYNKKHNGTKKSFREVLSDKLNVPTDEVAVEIGNWYKGTYQFKNDFYSVLPHIKEELEVIEPRLIIDSTGNEFWIADDNQYYRVDRTNEFGIGFYWKGGQWHEIFK
jgi:hypothetical protein